MVGEPATNSEIAIPDNLIPTLKVHTILCIIGQRTYNVSEQIMYDLNCLPLLILLRPPRYPFDQLWPNWQNSYWDLGVICGFISNAVLNVTNAHV